MPKNEREMVKMAEKKITKKEIVEKMMNEEFIKNNELYMSYLSKEFELLSKKRNSSSKANEKDVEMTNILLQELSNFENGATISELLSVDNVRNIVLDNGKYISSQKITALFNKAMDNGAVTRTLVKGKPVFTLINE